MAPGGLTLKTLMGIGCARCGPQLPPCEKQQSYNENLSKRQFIWETKNGVVSRRCLLDEIVINRVQGFHKKVGDVLFLRYYIFNLVRERDRKKANIFRLDVAFENVLSSWRLGNGKSANK